MWTGGRRFDDEGGAGILGRGVARLRGGDDEADCALRLLLLGVWVQLGWVELG